MHHVFLMEPLDSTAASERRSRDRQRTAEPRELGAFLALPLEDRTLLTGLSDVLKVYDGAVQQIAKESSTISAKIQATFGATTNSARGHLGNLLGLGDLLETPFQTVLSGSDWSAVASRLQHAGFQVVTPFTGTPDVHGNLMVMSWQKSSSPSITSTPIGATTGFNYLDDALQGTGILTGFLNGKVQDVVLQVIMGVDLQNGQPAFFLDANPAACDLNVAGLMPAPASSAATSRSATWPA